MITVNKSFSLFTLWSFEFVFIFRLQIVNHLFYNRSVVKTCKWHEIKMLKLCVCVLVYATL